MSTPSTYGLAGPLRAPVAQPSTLIGVGADQQRSAMGLLGAAAEAEQRREMANKQTEQDRKAGNAQLGSMAGGLAGGAAAGAMYGSAAGPWGALIGGAIGAILGSKL